MSINTDNTKIMGSESLLWPHYFFVERLWTLNRSYGTTA